jgi:hypothetical protein
MEKQATKCTIGQKLEGVFKSFGVEMYNSEFGEFGNHVFSKRFYKLGEMVIQQAIADLAHRKEGDEIRKQTHTWMGRAGHAAGSFAYWLHPTPTEDVLAVLDDDERRVLSAVLGPKFSPVPKESFSRERLRQVTAKVLRKLRTLN